MQGHVGSSARPHERRHLAAPFFFNDTATTEIYTLSLHDALPICSRTGSSARRARTTACSWSWRRRTARRSEEHTSEPQSHHDLVCRLLLEKKKNNRRGCWRRHVLRARRWGGGRCRWERGSQLQCRAKEKVPRRKSFFFKDTVTTEIYTLSLHDALPI